MSPRSRTVVRKPAAAYHHGNLKEALTHAALRLIEQGKEVSLRETARLAGVSPAAPFRHFRDKAALLTSVAEETIRRFRAEVEPAMDAAPDRPCAKIHALATAYLRFALRERAFFRAFAHAAELGLFDSEVFRTENQRTLDALEGSIVEGQRRGEVHAGDPRAVQLAARAFVYGLGRLHYEGQFPRFGFEASEATAAAEAALQVFEQGLFVDAVPTARRRRS